MLSIELRTVLDCFESLADVCLFKLIISIFILFFLSIDDLTKCKAFIFPEKFIVGSQLILIIISREVFILLTLGY